MKTGKVVGLDCTLIEIWKCLGEKGIGWLMEHFKVIFKTTKMLHKWRFSIVILLCKNKADIQDCNNYRGIKLLSHTMKLWARVIGGRLRRHISILKN